MRVFETLRVERTLRKTIQALLVPVVLVCGVRVARAAEGGGGATPGWQTQVQSDLAAREYDITWQADPVVPGLAPSWHAPNRAHGFRTYFTPEGIRVVPREEGEPAWRWGLSLIACGRGSTLEAATEARLSPLRSRIHYHRGAVEEWFENTPAGLKHGFILRSAPGSADPARDPVHLDLSVWGDLSPVVAAGGQVVDFVTASGARAVRYAGLSVTDARGEVLPAWMEGLASGGVRGIRLVVDDRGATYPLSVDPLATSPVWSDSGKQASARFGISVGTAGDVNGDGYDDLIVGADLFDNGETDEGRAFVYFGSPAGPAIAPSWSAESNQATALFGNPVGTAGDVNGDGYGDLVVGAILYDNGEPEEGRAFVYLGSSAGPAATPAWTAEGNQATALFGASAGAAGDVNGDGYGDLIVGAYVFDNGQADEGRAFVFLGSAGGLAALPAWTAESNQAEAYFGASVGTAGDVNGDGYSDVIVGSFFFDNGQSDEGRAFVYLGSASGLSAAPGWTAESDQANSLFGTSVGTAGDVNGDGYAEVIVGAYAYSAGEFAEGRAFIYMGSSSGPAGQPGWSAEGNQASASFGYAVGTAGDVNGDGFADVVVGAYGFDSGELNEGRAFVYLGSPSGPAPFPLWTAEGDQPAAFLGAAVGAAGDVNGDGYADVIVGAYQFTMTQSQEGRAFAYLGSASGLSPFAEWVVSGSQENGALGWSLGTAGDVNGDGFSDVIVGSPNYDNGQAFEGVAWVFLGSASGPVPVPAWMAEGDQADAGFGLSVGAAGDVNGDGYDDVIVGAIGYTNGEAGEGRSFVYLGSATGLATAASWMAESDQPFSAFAESVGTAGDVNGDGYADVIVAARRYDGGQVDEGRVFVYLGSAAGPSVTPSWTAESDQAGAGFGVSAGTAGDVNRDGYADIIVGADGYDNGETNEGRALVYFGAPGGLSAVPAWTREVHQVNCFFGRSAATAGDVNGDGYSDVVVGGGAGCAAGQPDEGTVFFYPGSPAGPATGATWVAEGDQAGAAFGSVVGTAGDVNGDGYADLLIGAPHFDNGQTDEGRAYVYLGSSFGPASSPAWTAESDQGGARFGHAAGTAGDVNGDGYADVFVGAPNFDDPALSQGRAWFYFGNGGRGLGLRPQQRRADGLAPIAAGGVSRSPGAFRLAALGRTPFGRGRLRLEWEVKELTTGFDATGTGSGPAWADTGVAGTSLDHMLSGLDPGRYHWRVRLRYDRTTTPFQGASRWLTAAPRGWQQRHLTLRAFLGGFVWEDRDGDGLRDGGEPGLGGVLAQLLDSASGTISLRVSDGAGAYSFELPGPGPYRLRFTSGAAHALTTPDQGSDDFIDSDADPVTGETPLAGPFFLSADASRWSAGLRPLGPCVPPDEPLFISNVRSIAGTDAIVLDFQDPNQPGDVTGYNVYRSSNPATPPALWPRLGDDVVDEDEATPNQQWVDRTGDDPPVGGAWFYQVTAYNRICDAEGPR